MCVNYQNLKTRPLGLCLLLSTRLLSISKPSITPKINRHEITNNSRLYPLTKIIKGVKCRGEKALRSEVYLLFLNRDFQSYMFIKMTFLKTRYSLFCKISLVNGFVNKRYIYERSMNDFAVGWYFVRTIVHCKRSFRSVTNNQMFLAE